LSALLDETAIPLIASGGVGTLDHLRLLARIEGREGHLAGAIVGRALYDGYFTVTDALAAVAVPGTTGPSGPSERGV
jgi:phosphoribosylformimino-5-aminoimidazole carboxamide ribonucleotide (ProFAR) isomerase